MLPERFRERFSPIFFFVDMVLFGLAIGFLDSSTVVPEFVGQATDSKVIVGLSGIMFALCWRLPQLAFAPAANRSTNKRIWMLKAGLPGRISLFFVAAVAIVFGRQSPGLMLVVFLVAYGAFAVLDGITSLAWVELIGSAVSDNVRGIMFSASQVVAGVLILLSQGVLREVLGPAGPGYPNNYAVIFIVSAVLFTISIFFLINVHEPRRTETTRTVELRDYLPYLRTLIVKDRPFRDFLIMRFLAEGSFFMVAPFYIGYEIERLGVASAQAVSDSLIAVTIGSLGGSILSGLLLGRFSSRLVIWALVCAVVAAPLLVLISPQIGYGAVLVAFCAVGSVHSMSAPGLLNWLIAYPDPGNRPVYSGIANTLGMFALVSPVIGGAVLQATSYTVLFAVALVLAVLALVTSLRLVNPSTTDAFKYAPPELNDSAQPAP